MSTSKTYSVRYRRKRQNKTDYKKRLRLLMSQKARLVVRSSLKNITAQIVKYDETGDKVQIQANSNEIRKLGWQYKANNIPASYLVGLLIGKKCKENNINEAVLDLGLKPSVKGSKIYSVLKGVIDSGIDVPHSDSILPSEDRIKGKHIIQYANNTKEGSSMFTGYKKKNLNPADIEKDFEEMKKKIMGAS